VIPDLSNPQSWNRYSYVTNRPVNFSDPTGHIEQCEGQECNRPTLGEQFDSLKKTIKDKYKWGFKGKDWTLDELRTVYQTGRDIESYVDGLTGGKGLQWMNTYMGDVTFSLTSRNRGDAPSPDSINLPSVLFDPSFDSDPIFRRRYIAHELAHTWDYQTSESTWRGPVGGVGDMLNDFVGGTLKWWSPRGGNPDDPAYHSPFIPADTWWQPPYYYGNGATSDYLADTFAYSAYGGDIPLKASLWVPTVITLEANAIP
jgi:hypothetical protein